MRTLIRIVGVGAALALAAGASAQWLEPNPAILVPRWDGDFDAPTIPEITFTAITPDLRYLVVSGNPSNLLGPASPPAVDGALQYYLIDRKTNERRAISIGASGFLQNLGSPNALPAWTISISDDGGRVVFNSNATNLDPAATTGATRCYLWDRSVGYAVALDVDPQPGVQGVCGNITGDGRQVVALCSQPVIGVMGWGVCVRNVDSGEIERLAPGRGAALGQPHESASFRISPDGSVVAFGGWQGTTAVGVQRVDLATGVVENVTNEAEMPLTMHFSGDGRFLLIGSRLYDHATRQLRTVIRRSPLSFPSRPVYDAVISRDGRFVAFRTSAGEFEREITGQLFPSGNIHVYRLDLASDRLDLVSRVGLNGPLAWGGHDGCEQPLIVACALNRFSPRISADGRHVIFTFRRLNLAPSYPPGAPSIFQLFIKDLGQPPPLPEPVPVSIDRSWLWLLAGLLLLSGWLGIRRLPGRVVD